MSASQHKTKRIEAGWYEYREFGIVRVDDIKAGHYGAWVACGFLKLHATSLKEAKEKVDAYHSRQSMSKAFDKHGRFSHPSEFMFTSSDIEEFKGLIANYRLNIISGDYLWDSVALENAKSSIRDYEWLVSLYERKQRWLESGCVSFNEVHHD